MTDEKILLTREGLDKIKLEYDELTYCDCIILTDEDPRGEDPYELLEMIAVRLRALLRLGPQGPRAERTGLDQRRQRRGP